MKELDLKNSKPRQRWTKSQEINGVNTSITVEEVENGFIIRASKYGSNNTKKNSIYINEEKTFISKNNPLKDTTPEEEDDDFTLGNINATISSMLGGLSI